MSERHDELTEIQRRAQEALRSLSPAAPDPRFRERLRREFASGRLAASAPRPLRSRPIVWIVPLAAAAAVFGLFFSLTRGPDWVILPSSSAAYVQVDGGPVSLDALTGGDVSLRGESVVQLSEGALELRAGGTLVMRVNAGSELTLPSPPRRWFGRTVSGRLERGEVLVQTGPAFPGNRLVIETPEGRAEVVGTAIAVFRDVGVTCVCVLEGEAAVGVNEADLEPIPPGKRKVMFGDERSPKVLDIEPQHQQGLEDFVRRNRASGKGH